MSSTEKVMNTNAKVSIWMTVGLVAVVIVAVIAIWQGRTVTAQNAENAAPASTISDDTRMLTNNPDAEVTFVEFLDFECEACGAAYPYIEQLRAEYGDRVNFAVRYFPLPGHVNAETSALAVEAAAQQDAFEPMYQMMYETQIEWGESQESKADVFRGYAEDLGLDLTEYDRAISAPATLDRVRADFDAGRQLGVEQTPTFFINDEPVELTSFEQLEQRLIDALEQ